MPAVRTVPALPWPTGDGGGTIKLSRRISEDELLAGVLKFTFDNAGRESVGSVVRDQNNQLIIRVDNDIFIVSPFPYGTDTLTLTRSAGEAAQAYSLINVELIVPPEMTVSPEPPTSTSVTVEFSRPVTLEEVQAHVHMILNGQEVAYRNSGSSVGWSNSYGNYNCADFEGETTSIRFNPGGPGQIRLDDILWV